MIIVHKVVSSLVQGTYPILLIEGDPYIVIRKTDGKVLFYGKGKL